MRIDVGDKLKFKSEKCRYTVTACDDRFVIATKPFNARNTFLYTIIDLVTKQRSSDNWYCRYDYDDPKEAAKAIPELNNGLDLNRDLACTRSMNLSFRNSMELDLERIDKVKPKKEGLVFRYYENVYFNEKKMVLEEKKGMRLLKRESDMSSSPEMDFYLEMLHEYTGNCMSTGFGQMKDSHMYRLTVVDWDYGEIAWTLIGHHCEWSDKSKHKLIEYKLPKYD